MSNDEDHTNYLLIYIILVLAFGVSLALGEVGNSPGIIASIFLIAAFKAYLVLMKFMHVASEPKMIKILVVSMVLTLGIVFLGMVTDVVYAFGGQAGMP